MAKTSMPYEKLSERDRRIVEEYKAGMALLTIADRYGMTCVEVQQIVMSVGTLMRDFPSATAAPTTGQNWSPCGALHRA
jgi:hypothetical protein